ncbi:MAG: pyridoxine 5'-phosphate synthase [Magnetococcales bacterium]|nr:pyridoxine 5'-phosphate synthase [Magnetococcales bacterium]
MIKLGVNVDHVATVRQARGSPYPDPVTAALLCENSGADSITVHLREDRRHIQDRDVEILIKTAQTKINLEMAATEAMVELAVGYKPADCCLVPEKREELTTEGGLDVVGNIERIANATKRLGQVGIRVSLFIDPEEQQIEAAYKVAAPVVELHTGKYADATNDMERQRELHHIIQGAKKAQELGLIVNAGHGLHYHNVQEIAAIAGINELNIGHAIISRALFDGLPSAVAEMKRLMRQAQLNSTAT